jgi:hypothetical protein
VGAKVEIRSRFEEIAVTALKEKASYKDFLADLLEAERLRREGRKKARLVREANFPKKTQEKHRKS